MGIMVFKLLGLYHSKHGSSSSKKQNSTVIEELCHRFSLADIRKSTNNFNESQLIGRGSFANVYRGYLKYNIAATDCIVAVKRMAEGSSKDTLEMFRNETEITCQLNHPHIVSLIGFCDHKDEKIIVYEYMSNGSLDKHLHGSASFSWKKRLEICIRIARAVHYLHAGIKRTILHCDLKPQNILLDSNMVPKLTDFGLSLRGPRFMSNPKPVQSVRAGTLGFIAPECNDDTFSDKSDVYSFGVTLLEVVVCAGRPIKIFEDTHTPIEEKIDPVLKGKISPECWEIYVSIIKRCLDDDPNERPTMGELEVELEQALQMQEQEDIKDNNGNYTLLTNTIIHR